MRGPPPELFDNSLEGAGYLPCATTPSLNRPLATLLGESGWVLVRRFDYVVHGGCVPSTKTIGDWWPLLERDQYVSVRESGNSGLRRRMTIRELRRHFDLRRDVEDHGSDVGNCLNATEVGIIRNSALYRTHRRPIQMREEDMTKFVDTKGKWGKDHVMVAEKGAWVVGIGATGIATTSADGSQDWHQDSYGACTYIRVTHGQKIVLMEHPLTHSRYFARMSDGDLIFLHPGLFHAVWTAQDSICLVGDLYLPGMMMSHYDHWSQSSKLIKGGESVQTYLRACVAVFKALYDDIQQNTQPRVLALDPHLIVSQYRPLMSVLRNSGNRHGEDLQDIATWLNLWPGIASGFGNLVDPQLRKLAVFERTRHPDGRKTTLHSTTDLEMLKMGFEPITETEGFRHKEGPCTSCRSRVEPCVVSRLRRLKNGQIRSGPCVFCRVQRVRCSYVQGP